METTSDKFNFNGLVILEMANNHQGSVEHGKKIISEFAKVTSEAGVKAAIKFQFRDLDDLIHPDHKENSNNKHIPRFISTRLSKSQYAELCEEARAAGLFTMSTPFDEPSVDLVEELDIDLVKVASSCAVDWPLLERVAASGKPLVCSTGGLHIEFVDNLVSFFEHRGVDFALMHCVSLYPTPNHKLQLARIKLFRERYPNVSIGFSTHEDPSNTDAVRVAYAMGARLFEKHVGVETEDIKLNAYSVTPSQLGKWLESYNETISMIGTESASVNPHDTDESASLETLMRGVYVKRVIQKGEVIQREDVYFAMPLLDNQLHSGQWNDLERQQKHEGGESIVADTNYDSNRPLSASLFKPKVMKKEVIYRAIHDIKGMLNQARVFVDINSNVDVLHPYGIKNFYEHGFGSIHCINREYCKDIYVLLAGQSFPKYYHTQKEKTLQVLFGHLSVVIDGSEKLLGPGDSLLIPVGTWHSLHSDKGCIVEAVSKKTSDDSLVFSDKNVEKESTSRLTSLVHWGRHQFDNDNEFITWKK